jgi:hypothetical protein
MIHYDINIWLILQIIFASHRHKYKQTDMMTSIDEKQICLVWWVHALQCWRNNYNLSFWNKILWTTTENKIVNNQWLDDKEETYRSSSFSYTYANANQMYRINNSSRSIVGSTIQLRVRKTLNSKGININTVTSRTMCRLFFVSFRFNALK